jgi:hypothetical protein
MERKIVYKHKQSKIDNYRLNSFIYCFRPKKAIKLVGGWDVKLVLGIAIKKFQHSLDFDLVTF